MVSLDVYRGKNRILLVFGPSPEDPQVQHQLTSAADNKDDLAERDLIVRALPSGDPESAGFRERYGVPAEGFTAILIGKDGTEKLRRSEPILAEELFATIDSMPMRQDEMGRGS